MYFHGRTDKTDFNGEAYKALTKLSSDCYGFYAAAYTLLSNIDGIEVLSVQRYGSRTWDTSHYWCLVNIDGTGWYHFDAINIVGGYYYKAFMKTTEELLGRRDQYWAHDQSLYPETGPESFDFGWWD